MGYSPRIYDPETGLKSISDAINKFDCEHFLYALKYKNFDEKKLEAMSKEVADYRLKLEREHVKLVEFAESFNKKFVTDNNQCFDIALILIRRLKSGISEVKRIYMDFCPRFNQRHYPFKIESNKTYSAFEYSFFSQKEFQLTLFELKDYPPCVQGLYNELSKFFFNLNLSLSLCFKVLKDEERIRKDKNYCNYLFEDFKNKMLQEFYGIISLISVNHEDFSPKNNPAIASRVKYSSTKAWAPYGFHNFTVTDVQKLIIKELLEEECEGKFTKEEIILFGNDHERILSMRNIIHHFDELLPDDYHRKNLPGVYIAMFMKWCGIYKETPFVNYFNETYNSFPNRKYKVITVSAVNAAKAKFTRNDYEGYNTFVEKLESMHFVPTVTNNMVV